MSIVSIFIEIEAFFSIETKSGLTCGIGLLVFLAIFFLLVSADFLKIVGGFGSGCSVF